MGTKTSNQNVNGSGVFTMDGANYGSTSGGPQPLTGLTGLSSGTDFGLTGDASNPTVSGSTGDITPLTAAMYQQATGKDPYLVGTGNYQFNVNPNANGNFGAATGTGNNTLGMGSPMNTQQMMQGPKVNQTGNSHVRTQATNFNPGILAQLTGGSTQGNDLVSMLQKMKVGSAN